MADKKDKKEDEEKIEEKTLIERLRNFEDEILTPYEEISFFEEVANALEIGELNQKRIDLIHSSGASITQKKVGVGQGKSFQEINVVDLQVSDSFAADKKCSKSFKSTSVSMSLHYLIKELIDKDGA